MSAKKIALTGIKPSGEIHLGNYLGAIAPALDMVKTYRGLYFIADYHALTTVRSKTDLQRQVYELAATWLALGLDPNEVVFYRQSDVPEIFELSWILACMAPKGSLNRAHAYKAASDANVAAGNDPDLYVSAGLYYYPVLMAADILAFGTQVVPVGQDQKQHLEMARDMAVSFNSTYGEILTVPEVAIQENVKTIPGVDGQKMSKSYGNTIPLFAPSKALRKRVMLIVTDSKGIDEPKDPDACNLYNIYKHFAPPEALAATREKYLKGGLGYGYLKQELFEILEQKFGPERDRYNALLADQAGLDKILGEGAAKARAIAQPILKNVRQAIGIAR